MSPAAPINALRNSLRPTLPYTECRDMSSRAEHPVPLQAEQSNPAVWLSLPWMLSNVDILVRPEHAGPLKAGQSSDQHIQHILLNSQFVSPTCNGTPCCATLLVMTKQSVHRTHVVQECALMHGMSVHLDLCAYCVFSSPFKTKILYSYTHCLTKPFQPASMHIVDNQRAVCICTYSTTSSLRRSYQS